MNVSPTMLHMLLDFLTAVLIGGLLSVSSYLTDPSSASINWSVLGTSFLVGAVLAARKWLQTSQLPSVDPPTLPH